MTSFKKWLSREGELDDGLVTNEQTKKRNQIISMIVVVLLATLFLAFKHFKKPRTQLGDTQASAEPAPNFGEIITDDFTDKDNRSALTLQRQDIEDMQQEVDDLTRNVERLIKSNESTVAQLKKDNDELRSELRKNQEASRAAQSTASNDQATPKDATETGGHDTFGARPLPPRPLPSYATKDLQKENFQYSASDKVSFDNQGEAFDNFDFYWADSVEPSYQRTTENYVPSGTFVTAKITGGADANAGAFGQSDTAPIVFQTVHEGILPNGEKTHLKDCTIIGSVYGDLSSSRGVVRTNTLSCIKDGRILDIPVQGTVFNFGRNGIRGTSILRNGKIVQMAGISGILTGIGETGAGLASTTSTSALGSTSSINSEDVGLSLLGNATSEVGSKLSDYYIALAELYHPFIEINPGGLVNIVFTQGFPLDDEGIERYEEKLAKEQAQPDTVFETITLNPLADEVNQQLR
ncbi:DNA repair protein [Vibrio parahaemolyticus]|uniref:DNA repair protein n=1 Tax=Vibrio parahaemolyticus TaxID=670 RepID=A0A9Q3UIS3_VIBPH|nr:TrbI/VirB10 family protein [Vibrio parahaemolyticus]MCC3807526.1 DNA repair protein [Vibrio parahaemolyticus]MCI9696494.1 DNA repair protein [Vibrio parahaemolyticus]MCI9711042.1 DNA repair protein [Vibrio parahaemolyticus]MCI9715922.1 DNA repair protein [Vibrio parahaemolyticus]